jgi:hypothetical protein
VNALIIDHILSGVKLSVNRRAEGSSFSMPVLNDQGHRPLQP